MATVPEKARNGSKANVFRGEKSGHLSEDCRSQETNAFEADEDKPSSETGCFEHGEHQVQCTGDRFSTSVRRKPQASQWNLDSRAAVTVFPKTVAEDYPVLKTPGKAKSYRPASGKLLPDLGASKVQVKLQDRSFRCVSPRVAETHRALMAVSEMNEMGHDVFFPRSDRGIKAYAYHEGSGTKLELERVNGVFELPVELVPYKRTTSKSNNTRAARKPDEKHREDRAPKVIGARNAAGPTESTPSGPRRSSSFGGALRITRRQSQLESEPCEAGRNNPRRHASIRLRMEEARLEAVSVGGGTGSGDQSRDVSYRTPGQLGERPMVPGGRERTQREDELQRQVEDDSAQGPVVRAERPSSAPSMDEWDGHLAAAHAEYRGWCPFYVAGKGKSETHRRMEASRDHGPPELRLDYAYTVRWFERPKLERQQSWLESSRRIVGCSVIPCRARAHNIDGLLASS